MCPGRSYRYSQILQYLTLGNQNASIAYLEELNPKAHVVDDGGVVSGSLVVHRPTTTNELKPWNVKPNQNHKSQIFNSRYFLVKMFKNVSIPALINQPSDNVLLCVRLFVPPAPKKCGLNIDEPEEKTVKLPSRNMWGVHSSFAVVLRHENPKSKNLTANLLSSSSRRAATTLSIIYWTPARCMSFLLKMCQLPDFN